MSDDTTPAPAPMTAKRLEELRTRVAAEAPDLRLRVLSAFEMRELLNHIDALTASVAELERERDAAEAQLKEARKVFAPVFKNYGPEWPDSEGLEVISSAPDDDDGEEGVGRCDFTLGQLRRALKDTTP